MEIYGRERGCLQVPLCIEGLPFFAVHVRDILLPGMRDIVLFLDLSVYKARRGCGGRFPAYPHELVGVRIYMYSASCWPFRSWMAEGVPIWCYIYIA